MKVTEIQIKERACGKRIPGGFYFIGDAPEDDLNGWLPRACRCKCGIKFLKPSRNVQKFIPYDSYPELRPESKDPRKFASFKPEEIVWVVTIGVNNYPTVEDYINEAKEQGVSRYIKEIPRGFKVGTSWCFILHPNCFQREVVLGEGELFEKQKVVKEPGIIAVFKPKAIQYVCKGDETNEFLLGLAEKGVTPVNVSYI